MILNGDEEATQYSNNKTPKNGNRGFRQKWTKPYTDNHKPRNNKAPIRFNQTTKIKRKGFYNDLRAYKDGKEFLSKKRLISKYN